MALSSEYKFIQSAGYANLAEVVKGELTPQEVRRAFLGTLLGTLGAYASTSRVVKTSRGDRVVVRLEPIVWPQVPYLQEPGQISGLSRLTEKLVLGYDQELKKHTYFIASDNLFYEMRPIAIRDMIQAIAKNVGLDARIAVNNAAVVEAKGDNLWMLVKKTSQYPSARVLIALDLTKRQRETIDGVVKRYYAGVENGASELRESS